MGFMAALPMIAGGIGSLLSGSKLFGGEKTKNYQQSTLGPEQKPLYNQLLAAGQGQGAGGAFGQSADYYRDLLSNNSQDQQAFAAPEMRQFNEDIIPSLSEQFAGMGSGGLSSSGFRNAAVNAGSGLAERIAAIRAGLRQQGAQGLQGIGQLGLGNYNENIQQQGTPGLLQGMAPGIGSALTSYGASKFGGQGDSGFGQSNPYGNQSLSRGGGMSGQNNFSTDLIGTRR